jgi:hypothetical protein
MNAIPPRGESLRRAVRFVSQRLREEDPPPLAALVNEAMLRFDLKPNEGEYLIEFYREAGRRGEEEEV